MKLKQNSVTYMRFEGKDLKNRWKRILEDISKSQKFSPEASTFRKSIWWKTGKVGAVFIEGSIEKEGKAMPANLKVQGTKPATSEFEMIQAFEKNNKSKIIRPPQVYTHIPWDNEKHFEALIIERARGNPVIVNNPPEDEEIDKFFNLYEEYRANCRQTPWVAKPKKYSYREHVDRWLSIVERQRSADKLGREEDWDLMEKGIGIVEEEIERVGLEFVHGHFTSGDLIQVNENEIVLFSNLFWGWRVPFYDAVFEYHWKTLWLEKVKNLPPELVEKERKRWFDKVFTLSEMQSERGIRKINLALLERAVPALMVDRFFLDQNKESTKIVVEECRKELKRLIKNFS